MNTHSVDLESSSNQYLYKTDTSSLSITGDITIEAWVKFESLPGSGGSMAISGKFETNKFSYLVRLDESSGSYKLRFFYSSNGTDVVWNEYSWTPSTGNWYHIAVVTDVSAHSTEFFIDGSSIGTNSAASATSIADTTAQFQIGASAGASPAAYFDGLIDEVRVWSDMRTSTEISNNKLVELVGNEANLVGYWKLNDSLLDETSNDNDLTSSGSPVFSTDVPTGFESPSPSLSESLSPSISSSSSVSLSPSNSESRSPSVSESRSVSLSSSASESRSPSLSFSSSISPSPSIGYSLYTRGNYAALPTNDSDLETIYTEDEEAKVSTKNSIRVDQTGVLEYMVHQFKNFVGDRESCQVECELQTTLSPSSSTVYLQIYNRNTTTWETIDSDNTSAADTDFNLLAIVSDLTNYKDASNLITCRVYQLST